MAADSKENPYRWARPSDVYAACQRIAEELGASKPRTPEQRAALAEQTRLLLLAAAQHVDPLHGEQAQQVFDATDLGEAAREWSSFQRRARTARYQAIEAAARRLLGDMAQQWLKEGIDHPDTYRAVVATNSDAGLRDQLLALSRQA